MLNTFKKINFLITKRQRIELVILTLLLFVGMVLEVFGLGILIPVISVILDPETIEKSLFKSKFHFPFPGGNSFSIFC